VTTDNSNIKHIVIPDDYPPVFLDSNAINRLRRVPNVSLKIFNDRLTDTDELIEKLKGAHTVIITRSSTKINSNVLESNNNKLRHISILGTATDNIDTNIAKHKEILITSTPDTHIESVAEHALALMLSLAKRIPQLDQRVRHGEWPRGNITLLRGKTLGIIGTGRVGETLKEIAEGIGMNVISYSLQDKNSRSKDHIFGNSSSKKLFYDILRESDIISLHARLSPETQYLISSEELSFMKPTAFLVNTARGGLIKEEDLVVALQNSTIHGAALDVFDQEPITSSALKKLSNVILSPHIAGSTEESLSISLNQVVDSVIDNIGY
tara:strand:- start:4446 stop:5417 length:972 start_codon:yes stop_codon:yes gene_type:complete